jgi:hypothetical protein
MCIRSLSDRLGLPWAQVARHQSPGVYLEGSYETTSARLVMIRPLCFATVHAVTAR